MTAHHRTHRAATRRRRPLARPARVLVAVLAALATVLAVTGVAVAYFTSTSSGTGSATTGTLAAPTAVAGMQTVGTGTVSVTWTASSGTPAPTGYYVLRVPTSGPVVPACGTSASSTTTATSCSDTGVPVGSYAYQVVAVYRSWTAISAASPAVSVNQASQTITFTSSPVGPVVGGSYLVTATGGGSGSSVVFSSGAAGVCTVSGSTVTFVHAGTCVVDANQAGNTYYAAAPQAAQTFTVAKGVQTIGFTSSAPVDAKVGGTAYTPTATGGASGSPVTFSIDATTTGVCSISGGVVTYQHVGTCTVDANQAGNADYLSANQAQRSYAVGQGAQAITFTSSVPANALVNDVYTVAASGGASGSPVTFSSGSAAVCTVSGSTVTFIASGTCTVLADQAGTADYLPAGQVQQQITVSKRTQTITFGSNPVSPTYLGSSYAVSASSDSNLTVTYSTSGACTNGGATVSFNSGAGSCTVTATQSGSVAYSPATATQTFTVAKANPTITFAPASPATAGTAGVALTASSNSPGAFTYSTSTPAVCTVSGATVSYTAAGQCQLTASESATANFNSGSASATVQVNSAKQNQTITFAGPSSPVIAGINTTATLSATATSNLAVTFSTTSASTICTVSGNTVTYVGAGTCSIRADQGGNGTYNPAPQVTRTVTVNAAPAFAITSRTSATPQNTTTVKGNGTPGATVSVYTCSGNQTSCGAGSPNLYSSAFYTNPQTATVQADGTWSVVFAKLSNGAGTFTIQAFQTSPSASTPAQSFSVN